MTLLLAVSKCMDAAALNIVLYESRDANPSCDATHLFESQTIQYTFYRIKMTMLGILGQVKPFVLFKKCLIDNATFRLHYKVNCSSGKCTIYCEWFLFFSPFFFCAFILSFSSEFHFSFSVFLCAALPCIAAHNIKRKLWSSHRLHCWQGCAWECVWGAFLLE